MGPDDRHWHMYWPTRIISTFWWTHLWSTQMKNDDFYQASIVKCPRCNQWVFANANGEVIPHCERHNQYLSPNEHTFYYVVPNKLACPGSSQVLVAQATE